MLIAYKLYVHVCMYVTGRKNRRINEAHTYTIFLHQDHQDVRLFAIIRARTSICLSVVIRPRTPIRHEAPCQLCADQGCLKIWM